MSIPPRILKVSAPIQFWVSHVTLLRKPKDSPKIQLLVSTPSQMRATPDISSSRLLAHLRPLTKVVSSIASSSCLTNTPWFHQRCFSEPRSTTPTSTSSAVSAWTSWRTSGLQPFKSDRSCCPSRHWCLFQTWMIPWIKRSLMPGRLTKKEPSRKPKSGPCSTPTTEAAGRLSSSNSFDYENYEQSLTLL